MKRLVILAAAATAAVSLGACMSMGHRDAYAGGYVDGYYDYSYGQVYDGYWGDGDVFYYRTGPSDNFHRDDARHFRHDNAGQGYRTFHARAGHAPDAHASR